MANFKLNSKYVTLSLTGPKTLFSNRKIFPFSRKADVNLTLLDFLRQKCEVVLTDQQATNYHAFSKSKRCPVVEEKYFCLSTSVKEFLEKNFKRVAPKGYSLRIARRRQFPVRNVMTPPAAISGENEVVVVPLLEALKSAADEDVSTVEIDDDTNHENDGQRLDQGSHSAADNITENSLNEDGQGSSRNTANAEETTNGLGSIKGEERPIASTSASAKNGTEGSQKSKKVTPEKNNVFPTIKRDIDESSCVHDIKLEGMKNEELRPLVAKNIKTLGNAYLIRLKKEVDELHRTKDRFGVSLWSKVAQRAPLCSVFIEKIFENEKK